MTDYQKRVLQEKEELDVKIKNLQSFMETNEIFPTLNEFEKRDLGEQLNVMRHYSLVLQSRINRF
jgi:hypothetical protein